MKRVVLPFTAIIGQSKLKQSLVLNAINPGLLGVLIKGERGTGKSTAVRALADLLPEIEVSADCRFSCHPAEANRMCEDCSCRLAEGSDLPSTKRKVRLVDLPLNASQDPVGGALDIAGGLQRGGKVV